MLAGILLFALLPFAFAHGEVERDRFSKHPGDVAVQISTGEQTYVSSPETCKQNDTCDLKQVFFRKEDYIIPPNASVENDVTIQSTRMMVGYTTETVADLTRYLFVQFTRGCMWYSYLDPNGNQITEFGILRGFLSRPQVQHVFPEWVVDSDDDDPAYTPGGTPRDRHFFLQWKPVIPSWIPDEKGKLYGEEKPTVPFGYITDMPGPAVYSPVSGQSINMSLEYKVCLFKTVDVPLRTNGTDIDIEKAVTCFRWGAKHAYDHHAQRFVVHKEVHQECFRPFRAREEYFRKERAERDKESSIQEKK